MALKTVRGLRSRLAARWSGRAARRPGSHPAPAPAPARLAGNPPAPSATVLGVPLLSVVVVVYNDQDRLTGCLDSLLSQTLRELEVIVVDEGSSDHSLPMIAAYADQDSRVRVLTAGRSAGRGQALNAGATAARAAYITFVDCDDTIPAEAYAHMVSTLETTGSDFAVGAVRGLKRGKAFRPAWVREVHRFQRLQITIEDFPDAMHDVIACNRVFRRRFFEDSVGPFPVGVAFEDLAPMVAAYVRAGSFDLLSATTSSVLVRDDPATIWQQRHAISDLAGRVAAKDRAWDIVSSEATPPVVAAWLGRVLDFDLPLYVEFALHGDADDRALVQTAAARFRERADDAAWSHVRVDRKLRLALAAAGDWKGVDRSIEYFRQHGSPPRTRVEGDRVLADLPDVDETHWSPQLLELSEQETSLAACIAKVAWTGDRLRVEGWAFVQAVDLSETTPTITAWLVDPVTSERVDLPVEPFSSAVITRWSNQPNHSYDRSGFRLAIDPELLAGEQADASVRWQLQVSVRTGDVVRTGPVHSLVRTGVAMRMRAGDLAGPAAAPRRVVPLLHERLGFLVMVRQERRRALTLDATLPQQLRGTLAWPDGSARGSAGARPTGVVARQRGKILAMGSVVQEAGGELTFALSLPARCRPGHVEFRVQDGSGRLHRVAWPEEHRHGREVGPYGHGSARWRRSPRGFVQISSRPVVLQAHAVDISAERVSVEVSLSGADPRLLKRAVLRSPLLTLPVAQVEQARDGRHRLVFPSHAVLWGAEPARPLPNGSYTLSVAALTGSSQPSADHVVRPAAAKDSADALDCGVSPELMEQMPQEHLTRLHGVTVGRGPGTDKLKITVRAPLGDSERGVSAQRRLAGWFNSHDFEPRDQVFFQCYRGEFTTDSQRAIHEELYRRGAPLDLVWGVNDHSVELPVGARPVLLGSRDWYEAIASSRYLCNNNDFDHFFHRRPHQRFLQTFHGYPFKSMGVSFWRARGLSAELIEQECRRRTDAWTSILLPASFTEEIYRQEYLYEGEVLVTGYPRNDVLVDAGPEVRAEVLRRLGVSPDKKVVLYAPTWRDTIATGDWSAKFYDALELDRLADALGSDHVLLLRGHNFNMREGVIGTSHATIVDVTRYPEITDLILAADVAILDYSSLRFDWVLTGKPVLFFVPDLFDYLSARTALFEYGPTAPGPLLSTTSEVIEAVLDVDTVSRDYAAARIEFNERFNALHDGSATSRVVDAFFGPASYPSPPDEPEISGQAEISGQPDSSGLGR